MSLRIFAILAFLAISISSAHAAPTANLAVEPWSDNQLVQPPDFVRELAQRRNSPPVILYVGVHTLYQGAHIPGAKFIGAASTEAGLAALKNWAAANSHSADIVIYCGCCPFAHCPNIRPAFIALRDLGFTHVRVLAIPTSFAADWVEKGYIVEKGL